MRLAEPGPARQGRPRGAGTERRVFSPEAAVRCQAGRVVSDAAPRLSAQVVEQQHRLVCFRANSSPTPCPDRCLFCLSIAHAQTRLSYSPPPACQNPQPNRWRFWPLSRGTFTARIHRCRKDTSELCVVWILQLQIWFEQLLCVVTFPLRWFSVNSEPPGAEARLKRGGSPSRVKSAPLWRRKASVSEGCSWFCCCVWVYEEGQVYPHRQGGLGLRLNLTLRQLVLTRTVPPMGHLPFIKHTHAHTPSPACSFLTKVPQTPEEERAFLIFEANTRERREAFFSIYFTCVVNRKIGWRQTFEGKSRDHF